MVIQPMHGNLFEAYRCEFPVTQNYIYLDHAGIAPLSLRVKSAIETFLSEATNSGAFLYPKWAQQIVEIRRSCARLINARHDEIAFIKNTSHGLSIVAEGLDWKPGDNILLYEKEFPSNMYPWMNLQRKGVNVKVLPSRDGRIDLHDIEELMDAKTRLLALSSVQFANGFRIDLNEVGNLCRRKNVLFCIDAIQSLGIIPMDVKECNIDFLSADAHKWLLGPEGIGIFYCKEELAGQLDPPLIGWKSVKNEFAFDHPDFLLKSNALRFEEGSMNLLGIFGLGAAVELLLEVGIQKIEEQVHGLGDVIIRSAEERGYSVLTPKTRRERGGNITMAGNFDLAKVKEELQKKRIMVNVRGGGLRISPHFYNTAGEIAALFKAIDQLAGT
jgi:cysteine desulfurase/selenocysteine lyase